jgi:hypothetical protein
VVGDVAAGRVAGDEHAGEVCRAGEPGVGHMVHFPACSLDLLL